MAPRPGGEADKFGNRYEGAWAIRHALYVLLGSGTSLCMEPGGPLGEGIEFVYRHDHGTEVHQVKRQNRNANSWNVVSLRDKGVWESLRSHVEAGRMFHFVSVIPARALDELADRARRSDDLASFEAEWLTEELRGPFDSLSSADIFGSATTAWRMMRGLRVEWHDERDLVHVNAVLAEQVLTGAPGRLAALALGQLLLDNLGTTLDAAALIVRLAPYGLRRAGRADAVAVSDAVSRATRRWAVSVERELLRPAIPREEAVRLVAEVRQDTRRLILLTGTAGGGKSAVLHRAFTALDEAATPVLAFRLDRLEPFSSTRELGQRIGLPLSPVGALGAVADGRPCVLLVDQLDAVSMASGRIPEAFDAVADLVDEAAAHPAMRVVLACRAFDAEADHRIRRLAAPDHCARVAVESLSDAQVDTALTSMGLAPSRLAARQRALLRSPLHLVLLAQVADQEEALSFHTTRQLFDVFWDTKREKCARRQPSVRFHDAVSAVTAAMSDRQRLSVPYSVLDTDELAASRKVLESEHVCVRDGRQLAFFHESFFDYAFARDWLRRDESLVAFLTGGEQELFRRGQLRQVLDHLRELDPDRFAEEIEALLTSPEIRYHLKDLTLAVLRGLDAPTATEWDAVARVLDTRPPFRDRLVDMVGMPAWFRRADDEGVIENWLASADAREQDWAVRLLMSVTDTLPDRVARLLEPHAANPWYGSWLKQIVPYARLAGSRRLFDLLLDAVRADLFADAEHVLWDSAGELAAQEPTWAVELLDALLSERPDALRLDSGGRVAVLLTRDHAALEMVTTAAGGAPEEFCVRLLPVLLAVMSVTAFPARAGRPVCDRHFWHRHPDDDPGDLGDALLQGMAKALRSTAIRDAPRARLLVEPLVSEPYEAAQWLLYQALAAAGPALALWSAEILLQGRHRFLSGYAANAVWGAREVLRAVGDALPDETLGRLERSLLHLRHPTDEKHSPWHEFTLLTAVPEGRLSERGRRRIGELRRLHGDLREPDEPEGVTGGFVGPPIPPESARHMSDDQWLGAMRKHSRDRTDWETDTGGARELSHVLRNMTVADPGRFARLALRIVTGTHPAYGASLLLGLGDAEPYDGPETVFAAVRHFAGRGRPAQDRWLGHALQKYLDHVPLDLVEVLLSRALDSAEPGDADDVFRGDGSDETRDLFTAGINTVRGSAAESLGDLLVHDPDGSRAALFVPHLSRLAADPSLDVRACVAYVLRAALRHDRPAVADAFAVLVRASDHLLASPHVARLAVALMRADPASAGPLTERMLASPVVPVRRIGGQVAALAAMEWETPGPLARVLAGNDPAQRQGSADVCAERLLETGDAALAHNALVRFFHDPEEQVREAAAAVAVALRDRRLAPYRRTLTALIDSRAFEAALMQLLITLEHAPDRVDELVLTCVRRFLAVRDAAVRPPRRSVGGADRHVGRLLVRAYVQATSPARRSEILDLLDRLLLMGSFGVARAIDDADRR
ncbi:NACHT domain-containing protein [Streptomyces brasiliscabiei]|uniref:NACHT domain-containing protein n=1 Tax=Streptomyces brasiliscabiei TaxID=2736302 RepID=UPI001C12904A|nr:ATP-binding protein [Streptomyces brasiliscabiei]